MKKVILLLICTFSSIFLMSQSNNWQLHLQGGITHTEFYGKQPFSLYTCIEGCHVTSQQTTPSFQLGGEITFSYKEKYPIGFGYRFYQLNIKSTMYSLFDEIDFQDNDALKYHSFFLSYRHTIFNTNPLTWRHSIGTDKVFEARGHLRPWSFFYQTSLDIPIASTPIVFSPSIQLALGSYTKKDFEGQALMRPIIFSLNLRVPLVNKTNKH